MRQQFSNWESVWKHVSSMPITNEAESGWVEHCKSPHFLPNRHDVAIFKMDSIRTTSRSRYSHHFLLLQVNRTWNLRANWSITILHALLQHDTVLTTLVSNHCYNWNVTILWPCDITLIHIDPYWIIMIRSKFLQNRNDFGFKILYHMQNGKPFWNNSGQGPECSPWPEFAQKDNLAIGPDGIVHNGFTGENLLISKVEGPTRNQNNPTGESCTFPSKDSSSLPWTWLQPVDLVWQFPARIQDYND